MASFYDDNDDLRYYVERGIDWPELAGLLEQDFTMPDGFSGADEAVEFYREVLDLVGRFAADEIAPRAAELDTMHPKLVNGEVEYPEPVQELHSMLNELGLHGLTIPRELGGMNAPLLLFHLQTELLSRADVSVAAHHGFYGGIATSALAYSVQEGTTEFDPDLPGITDTRFREVIDTIVAGEAWGSMDITEPDAGSDMAALRCKGEQDEDGNWFVTGQKIYITSGHGRWHFVIARTEAATDEEGAFAGLDGLSMFLVEAYKSTTKATRSASSQLLMPWKRSWATMAPPPSRSALSGRPAQLIGERGEGFKHMLVLMNGARVGVGFEALGLCEAAVRAAATSRSSAPRWARRWTNMR